MAFSQVQLLGNVGRDPEMSYTPDGTAITKFSVAITTKKKGTETTAWYSCTAFRGIGETINSYVHKGDMVFVQGALDVRQYTTKDGRNGTALDVVVDKFNFAGGKRNAAPAPATTGGDEELLPGEEDHPF